MLLFRRGSVLICVLTTLFWFGTVAYWEFVLHLRFDFLVPFMMIDPVAIGISVVETTEEESASDDPNLERMMMSSYKILTS